MINKTYDNIHDAYEMTMRDVYFHYDYKTAPRGLPIREKTDYTFRITNPVAEAIVTHDLDRNKIISEYTRKEVELYNNCANTAVEFGKASKFWETLANPDGTVNSAYGHLIWKNKSHGNPRFETAFYDEEAKHVVYLADHYANKEEFDTAKRTPWEWAKMSLIQDKDTRQALLRFSLPEHQWVGNKDQTCTMHGNFLIREDKLHLSIVMRSNDLVLGLVYDLPWFISLIDRMVDELKEHYPNLTKGTYTHTVHSLHIYERNEDMVRKMLNL